MPFDLKSDMVSARYLPVLGAHSVGNDSKLGLLKLDFSNEENTHR